MTLHQLDLKLQEVRRMMINSGKTSAEAWASEVLITDTDREAALSIDTVDVYYDDDYTTGAVAVIST